MILSALTVGSFGLVLAQNGRAPFSRKGSANIVLSPLQKQQAADSLSKLPWAFEPNAGQTDSRVKFLARADGATVFLTQDEAVIVWRAQSAKIPRASASAENDLRLQFVAANKTAAISGEKELPGKTNYLIGKDPRQWRTNIPHFSAVTYKDIYPGITARFYGGPLGLEYDLAVSPQANLQRVAFRTNASGLLRIGPDGNLFVRASGREILMRRPEIYQLDGARKIPVAGGYRILADNSFGFAVGAHRRDLPLIIDPSISITYTTFLGGNGAEKGNSVALDSTGAIYVGGATTDVTTFPEKVTCDDVQSTTCGGTSATGKASTSAYLFVAKIIPSNATASQLTYLTFIGGSGDDEGGKIALDNATSPPSLAVVGWTTSADFPVTNGSALKGPSDLTVSKLNGTGNAFTAFGSMYFGGTGSEATQAAAGVATDSSGNVYVTSDTTSTDLPQATSLTFPTGNGFHTTYGGGVSDGFLAVFGATTGSLTYSTYFGINAMVGSTAVAVDSSGNAYVTGFTTGGTGFPATNAFQPCFGTSSTASPCPASNATDNAFIMQINTNPPALLPPTTPIYASFLGGSGADKGFAIALDTQSPPSAYLAGSTSSVDFPANATNLPFQPCLGSTSPTPCPPSSATNAFFAVVSQTASTFVPSLAYSTYLGGTSADSGQGVAVFSTSDVLVTGTTTSNNFPVFCPSQNFTGTQDAFIAAFNPSIATGGFASLLDSTFLGGSASSESNAIATDASGDAIIFGDTGSHDFPLATNAGTQFGFQPTCTSCTLATAEPDAFLTKSSISTAASACVAFAPLSANFGSSTPVGMAAVPVSVQLTDDGNLALTITGMNILSSANSADFSLSPNGCTVNPATPPSLAVGANCSFQLNLTPSVAGPESATLQITGTDTNSDSIQQNLDLTGTGVAPEVTLTTPTATCPSTCPAALTFGSVTAGTTSPVQIVTLTNTGNSALTVSSVALDASGNPTDFTLDPAGAPAPCGSNNPIAQNGTCTIAVEFTPQSGATSGTPFSAQVDIVDNANNNSSATQTISLTGTGISQTFVVNFTPANPSLTFSNQPVGAVSSPMSVTLTNSGTGTLNISSITFTNAPNPNPFTFDPSTTTCPLTGGTVGPNNAACIIAVDFDPTAVGPVNASVSIADNSSNVSSPQLIPVSGTGAGAVASITPAGNPPTLTFGSIQVGTTSAVQTATLTNTGNSNLVISPNGLTITGANPVDFQLNAQTTCVAGGSGLAPNGSCQIAVDFAPQASGALFASVSIADNAGGSPQTIALSGTGTQPVASLSQTTISFGSVNVNTTSTSPTVTLTNSGNQTLSNITVSIDPSIGTPADFAFGGSNTCKTVGALQPNGTCSITISFTPAATGPVTGQVDITDNAANSPQTISLNGMGTAPGVMLSPSTLSFPNEDIGMASPSQNVTLTNTGNGSLTINSIGFSGPGRGDFGQTNNCPSSPQQLASSNSCIISVFFQPAATGQRTASLSIADTGPGSPQTVGLAGMGTQPLAVLTPNGGVSFPATVVGTASGTRALTVTNQGTGPLVISNIAFSGTNPGDFSETDNCTGAANAVAIQKSCAINVNFVPTAPGARSANIVITDNTASGTQQAPVGGQATDFQFATSGGSSTATITAGESAIFPLQVNPIDGFTGTVTFGCTNPPPKGSCTTSPPSVNITGSTPVSFSVSVGTMSNALLIPRAPRAAPRPRIPAVVWLPLALLGLIYLRWASSRRKRLVPRFVLAFAVLLLASCAGGGGGTGGGNGTPPGTYIVTATGSVGSGAARQIKLTVIVQ